MEKDQSEIEASTGLGNEPSEEKMLKRKREGEEPISDLREAEIVLPFAETSSLWKKYEEEWAIPQRPHFAPLINFPHVLREKCALVLMKSFQDIVAELMDDVPRSRAFLYQYQEALLQLEDSGFNAKLGLARIDELLSLNHEPPNVLEEQQREREQPNVLEEQKGEQPNLLEEQKGVTPDWRSKRIAHVHITFVRCNSNGEPL